MPMAHRALALAALLAATALAGCLGASEPLGGAGAGPLARAYDTSRGWSTPLSPAVHQVLEAVEELVPSVDGTPMSIGIFRPDMAGCDWAQAALPAACRLPTVMDAGPYYGPRIAEDKFRPPLVEWLVPRGYAVVQMSLRGTGASGGCLEFKSPKDVDDVGAVVGWLAAQPWSNGNVGMMGRSYDGTGAWSGAASGHPALKAIAPISGAVDGPGLYYKNGTAEERGPVHGVTYWPPYGLGLGDGGEPTRRAGTWDENLCREALLDVHAESASASATGDASSPYWRARDLRPLVLERYRGAVWVIQGLQDWNVNPSQAVPFVRELQRAGIDTRAWLGVWGHAYPDRVDEHRNVRWDWADVTVRWFDQHLRGGPPLTGPAVEVEDSLFVWRGEATYPPDDAVLVPWELGAGGALAPAGEAEEGTLALGLGPAAVAGLGALGRAGPVGDTATFTSEPLAQAARVAGLPQLHVQATPTTPHGTHLFAELYDVFPDGRTLRLGWAAMNLRFHAGGNTEPRDLVPGQPVVAQMEFEPVDALVGQGHRLRLVLHQRGVEDVMPSPSPAPVQVALGGGASTLALPLVERPSILPTYVPPGLPAAGAGRGPGTAHK